MSRGRVVYIYQYGAWWSATQKQWQDTVISAISEDGYDLDATTKRLKRKPASVLGNKEDGFMAKNGIVVNPIDWTRHDWERQRYKHQPENAR